MTVLADNMDRPEKIARDMSSVKNVSEGMGTKSGGKAVTAEEYNPRVIGSGSDYKGLYGGDKPTDYDALRMHTMDIDTINSTVDGTVPGRGEPQAARIP